MNGYEKAQGWWRAATVLVTLMLIPWILALVSTDPEESILYLAVAVGLFFGEAFCLMMHARKRTGGR